MVCGFTRWGLGDFVAAAGFIQLVAGVACRAVRDVGVFGFVVVFVVGIVVVVDAAVAVWSRLPGLLLRLSPEWCPTFSSPRV